MDRRSASDVVKDVEAALTRAASIRAEARRLVEAAIDIERDARSAAVLALGEAHGEAAFSLALLSFPEIAESSVVEGAPAPAPVPAAIVDELPVPAEAPPQAGEDSASGRTSMWGVDVPNSRLDEAKALVDEATAMAAQGKKASPYATDRGKNAWRRSLFAAVMERLCVGEAVPASAPVVTPMPRPVVTPRAPSHAPASPAASAPQAAPERPAPVATAAPSADEAPLAAGSPVGPPHHPEGFDSWSSKGDPLDDDPPVDAPTVPPGIESHPVPEGRRAGFGNPVPKPAGLSEAQTRVHGTGLRPVRRPSFVSR